MAVNKNYAIFGLGRYGSSVARELVESGAEVLAVDIDEERVNEAAGYLPLCKCADITDPEVIRQLGISNMDVVVISMATNLEASVMAATLCKEAGVPTVIAKCGSEMHRKILLKVGADKAVIPEFESGIRLAKNLISSDFIDIIDLNDNISMVEMGVKPEWVNKSLAELNLRKKYSMNVVAIRNGEDMTVEINPEMPLAADMQLVVIAETSKLRKL